MRKIILCAAFILASGISNAAVTSQWTMAQIDAGITSASANAAWIGSNSGLVANAVQPGDIGTAAYSNATAFGSAADVAANAAAITSYAIDPETLQTQITANATAIDILGTLVTNAAEEVELLYLHGLDSEAKQHVAYYTGTKTVSQFLALVEGKPDYQRLFNLTTNPGETLSAARGMYAMDFTEPALLVPSGNYTGDVLQVDSDVYLYSNYQTPSNSVVFNGDVLFTTSATNCGIVGLHVVGDVEGERLHTAISSNDYFYPMQIINCVITGNVGSNSESAYLIKDTYIGGTLGNTNSGSTDLFAGTAIGSSFSSVAQNGTAYRYQYFWDCHIRDNLSYTRSRSGGPSYFYDCDISAPDLAQNQADSALLKAYFSNCTFRNATNWNITNPGNVGPIDQTDTFFIDCTGLPTNLYGETQNCKLTNCFDWAGNAIPNR